MPERLKIPFCFVNFACLLFDKCKLVWMKAIEITCNGQSTTVGVADGLLTVNIESIDANGRKGAFLYSGAVDYAAKRRDTWHKHPPIAPGDEFGLRMVEVEKPDAPQESAAESRIVRPESKLESFRRLGSYLKERGWL